MDATRNLIDYAMDSNGVEFRNQLYASIHDRVTAAIEAKKQELAGNLVRQEAAGELNIKKEYDDKDEAEHGVYHGKKKIGYIVHNKKSDTHTAYHGHKYGKDDYENSDDFSSHEKAVNQIKSSAGLKEEKEEGAGHEKSEKKMMKSLDKNKDGKHTMADHKKEEVEHVSEAEEEKDEKSEKEEPKKPNAFTMRSKTPSEFAKSSSGGKTKETKTGRTHSSGDRY